MCISCYELINDNSRNEQQKHVFFDVPVITGDGLSLTNCIHVRLSHILPGVFHVCLPNWWCYTNSAFMNILLTLKIMQIVCCIVVLARQLSWNYPWDSMWWIYPIRGNNKRERHGRVFINKLFSKELSQVHDVLAKLLSRCLCFSSLDVHQKHG